MTAHGYMPDVMMKVVIVPIVKKKGLDPGNSANYRPIALASILSKIYEMCLMRCYEKYLHTSSNQFGYKKHVGTELAVYSVKQVAHYYVRHNTPVYACYLDASKAFDLVNHYTLLDKLCKRNLPASIIRLFIYWFRTQRFVVRWGSSISKSFPVLTSVRQGGILSGNFFSIYLEDLSKRLNATDVGCRIGGTIFNHAIYADDVCIMVTTIRALKILLKICEDFSIEHDLKFNPTKSMCQCFCDNSYDDVRPLIKLCGKTLQWQDTVRYLGYDINCHNRDYEEMMRRRREMMCNANLISSRFGSCSREVKVYLFKTFFSSVYCSSVWCPVDSKIMNKLRVTYNDCFRIIMRYGRRKSASEMFCECTVKDFYAMRRVSAFSLLSRIAISNNNIINAIVNSNVFIESAISRSWRNLLYV